MSNVRHRFEIGQEVRVHVTWMKYNHGKLGTITECTDGNTPPVPMYRVDLQNEKYSLLLYEYEMQLVKAADKEDPHDA